MPSAPEPSLLADRLTDNEAALFRHMLQHGGVLVPRPHPSAALGFVYPEVGEYLGYGPNQDLDYLLYRERQNLLRGVFYDRVNLCSGCLHATVNFREVCPNCSSANVRSESVIHHFRCAFVGREEAFRQGVGLVCPKCGHGLRSIGKDFERPTDLHLCAACDGLFSDPEVEGLCLQCGKRFPQEERVVRDVFQFRVTAAVVPALEGRPWQMHYPPSVADELPEVVSTEFLLTMLDLEIRRAVRYKRPLCVVAVSTNLLRAVVQNHPTFDLMVQLHAFVDKLQRIRRNTDLVGRLKTGDLLFILTETPVESSGPMIARVRAELEPAARGPILAGAAGLNLEAAESADQLIGRAVGALSGES